MAKTGKGKKISCDLCCDTIEKDHESLKCDGECGSHVHRYCAGVTKRHFTELNKGSSTFMCQYCNLKALSGIIERQQSEIAILKSELRNEVIQQQQSEIAALKAELLEVKALLTAKQSTPAPPTTATSYAAMVAGAPHRPQQRLRQPSVRGAHSRREPRSAATTTLTTTSSRRESNEPKERVSGARRIWGTLPTTHTAAMISTLRKLTKAGSKVRVFRKSRTSRQGKACWWFHLKGDETDLCELEKEWNLVTLQTKWKLEYCYKSMNVIVDDSSAAPTVNVQANDSSATANDVMSSTYTNDNDSNDSVPTPTNAPTPVDLNQLSNNPLHTAHHPDDDQTSQA